MQPMQCQLKFILKDAQSILKDDLIFHKNQIWKCMSKQMSIFKNLQTTHSQTLILPQYQLLKKLELIPLSWSVSDEGSVKLVGRQLGMGPTHTINIMAMGQFEELNVVKRAQQMGKQISYKVILCETNQDKMLIVGVDLLQ